MQCNSSLRATRQIELAMHRAMYNMYAATVPKKFCIAIPKHFQCRNLIIGYTLGNIHNKPK